MSVDGGRKLKENRRKCGIARSLSYFQKPLGANFALTWGARISNFVCVRLLSGEGWKSNILGYFWIRWCWWDENQLNTSQLNFVAVNTLRRTRPDLECLQNSTRADMKFQIWNSIEKRSKLSIMREIGVTRVTAVNWRKQRKEKIKKEIGRRWKWKWRKKNNR